MERGRIWLALAVLMNVASTALAQSLTPLSTDRPGQATSTDIVPQGALQFELGMQYQPEQASSDERNGDLSLPQLITRWAPLAWLELRFGGNTLIFSEQRTGGATASSSELSLATKMKLYDGGGWRPTFSTLIEIDIPIQTSAGAVNAVDPSLDLLLSWDITDDLGVDVNAEFSGPSQGIDDIMRALQVQPVVCFQWATTDRFSLYSEWFATIEEDQEPQQYMFDGGAMYLVTNDLQVDFSAGKGLNFATPDFYVGLGLVWRWWLP